MVWSRFCILLVCLFNQNSWAEITPFPDLKNTIMPTDLPLILVPAPNESDLPMVFFISGDGGWISFDQYLAESIAEKGMPVVGLDARKYFWKEKTPEQATTEISAAIARQMKIWKKKNFVLIGFSFGASIVPFVANRLPPALKKSLRGVIALSPNERTDFEVRIADMLNIGRRRGEYNVLAEMQKIKALGLVCFFGHDEDIQVEIKIEQTGIAIVRLPGGHHYEDNYPALTEKIYNVVRASSPLNTKAK